jgi:hypothetical protein
MSSQKLTTKEPYHGNEHVQTTNRAGMRIHNIGHATLSTPSSRSLDLKQILHVPQACNNLLSMSKLSNDNNVSIELHPYDLFVKDLETKEAILRGRCHGGLYEIKAPVIKQALSSVKVSRDMWHSHLGHPALPFSMFFIVMIYLLLSSPIKIDQFVMLVNKERVISYLSLCLLM